MTTRPTSQMIRFIAYSFNLASVGETDGCYYRVPLKSGRLEVRGDVLSDWKSVAMFKVLRCRSPRASLRRADPPS